MDFQDYKITGVDKDRIERDATQLNAFKYPLILSGKPDDLWIKFMHQAYRISSFSKKRQYVVVGNMIIVIVFADDTMQVQLDFFKELVTLANDEYRKMLQRKDEERKAEEERKRKEQENIDRLRNEVDRLKF